MSTPTPRTDAAWASSFEPCEYRAAHTARTMRDECATLERELAIEREKVTMLLADAYALTKNWHDRAERAEAELKEARRIVTEQSNLRLIAEDGLNHVTALKNKIHERYQSDLASKEAELATERAKVCELRACLQNLCDEQNGAPLERRRDQWQATMDEARAALAATEETK